MGLTIRYKNKTIPVVESIFEVKRFNPIKILTTEEYEIYSLCGGKKGYVALPHNLKLKDSADIMFIEIQKLIQNSPEQEELINNKIQALLNFCEQNNIENVYF